MTAQIESIQFHGIEALRLTAASGATAVVSLLGAQVLSWITPDGREQLFLSDKAVFDGSRSIRGGVPVCFPQFSGLGELPKHGMVRQKPWRVEERACRDGYAMTCLVSEDDDATRSLWPHAFRAEVTVVLEAARLDVELAVENTGDASFTFTGALHTYLRVKEVENIQLHGLKGLEYRDAANGNVIRRENGEAVTVESEVDRVYHDSLKPVVLTDSGRNLTIATEGFPDTVVWNPWVEQCAALPDMERLDFRRMLCVEAAVARQPVHLLAGASWFGRQTLEAV